MAKRAYKCSNCNHIQASWGPQCPACKEYETLERTEVLPSVGSASSSNKAPSSRSLNAVRGNAPKQLKEVSAQKFDRIPTLVNEFDRVLGGGFVPGGVVLLSGNPGAGKSTLCLVAAQALAEQGKKVLIISGEETEAQIASRGERIGANHENIYLMSENSLPSAVEQIQALNPDIFMLDSLQTFVGADSESRMGSPSQVADVANTATTLAKTLNIPALLIGQVTKSDNLAGPKLIEHLVDSVLYFESNEDSPLRILRGVKNRFGSLEVGVFEHVEDGFVEVSDPSGFFLHDHAPDVVGYATSILIEGNRALPIEIQALVTPTGLPNPRKISNGLDHGRVMMIAAILEKHGRMRISDKDLYVSTTGGIVVKDSSIDLAIAAAIISSAKNATLPEKSVFMGETSLTGEIRPPKAVRRRSAEARRLGFKTLVQAPQPDFSNSAEVKNVRELFEFLRPSEIQQ